MNRKHLSLGLFLTLCLLIPSFLQAIDPPQKTENVASKEFAHSDLTIPAFHLKLGEVPRESLTQARERVARLRTDFPSARIDARSGRFVTLLPRTPLVPGKGVGNELAWDDFQLASPDRAARESAAVEAFLGYLNEHRRAFDVDLAEFGTARVASHGDGEVYQIHIPRVAAGVKVRDNFINAVINHGNLVLLTFHQWGDLPATFAQPQILPMADASAAAVAHVAPLANEFGKGEQVWIPLAEGSGLTDFAHGQGYRYRLAWSFMGTVEGDMGNWEALVDAESGELLSFKDTNHYGEVKGGVLPVSNDGTAPDGVEQSGWPMPYQTVTTAAGTETSDTGGNIPSIGSLTADLVGPFVDINDNCGSSSLTQNDNIDWGESAGTDCTTPGFGGSGNTHASRTGFYELNKIIEMAQGWLPANSWLGQTLTSNMNINSTCNAFWSGTVNFYRSGGGCFNTGEIAGVFDHEWGHGIDDNDVDGSIGSPSGEGIADIYTALRLNDSCTGRGFRATPCTGFGDPCLTCTGVRDIDYEKRQSGNPHTYTWSNSNCGGSVHCVGAVYSEAVWSLWKRKLQSAPYNYDDNTSHEIVNRLTFIGAGTSTNWFSGGPPFGGCGGSSGYLNYLAADDDDGNLSNGTPHMQAIYDAFNDQEIACDTPTVQESGCSGTPTAAPTVATTRLDKAIGLSWNSVADASSYGIFRTEGVFECAFGKVKLGETSSLTWNDSGLQNGRDYSYVVCPMGTSDACMGPCSACATTSPVQGPGVTATATGDPTTISGGDGDAYLDNCESGEIDFQVTNTGLGGLTNVRVVGITPSNPGTTVNNTLPQVLAASLAEGANVSGTVLFDAGGLTSGEELTFTVEVTANEMTGNATLTLTVSQTETDLAFTASETYSFESDAEGWTTLQGTFNRSNAIAAADGTFYEQSSANADNQCDQIQSPTVVLSSTSTLTLSTNYDIEDIYGGNGVWYDRANIGVVDSSGTRNLLTPDSGRAYDASGPQGTCGTTGQDGWAGTAGTWAASVFNASQLGAYDGQSVQLDVRYGTDASVNGDGFRFDAVTLTNFSRLAADQQSNTCVSNAIFVDGFESGDLSAWSNTVPLVP